MEVFILVSTKSILMIDKVNEAGYLTDAEKNSYLGGAHGMRAFLYFQLLRTYGDVIVYLQHTEGKTIVLSKVARKQDAAADVMKQIKGRHLGFRNRL